MKSWTLSFELAHLERADLARILELAGLVGVEELPRRAEEVVKTSTWADWAT